jgi:hypothetical protein
MLLRLHLKMEPGAMIAFMQAGVVPYIQQRIANRFLNEGDDVVGKWHPLKTETETIRIRHGYPGPHPINVRTGQMRALMTGSFGNAISGSGITQLEYPNQGNMTGQLARKIMTAQGGSAFPPTPPRPVLGFNLNDSIALTALLAGYLS